MLLAYRGRRGAAFNKVLAVLPDAPDADRQVASRCVQARTVIAVAFVEQIVDAD